MKFSSFLAVSGFLVLAMLVGVAIDPEVGRLVGVASGLALVLLVVVDVRKTRADKQRTAAAERRKSPRRDRSLVRSKR
ncbi:MAG: hypothetical protein GEU98_18675 [Pseudonocardiaceae bacterium]|nr:hypothetical protein [Pseudonocardiaceae bacterium]